MKLVNELIKEIKVYEIDMKAIRTDSVVRYTENGKDWYRGIVKYVDKHVIKVVRSIGVNKSFSSTRIAGGSVSVEVELY